MSSKFRIFLFALTGTLTTSLAPVCANAATGLPFSSGFESGNFSEWDGGLETSLSVSTANPYVGTYSARSESVIGRGTDNYKDKYFGDHPSYGGEPVSEFYIRFYFKMDTGYDFGSEGYHKIAIVNFEDNQGLRRYQIVINVNSANNQYVLENFAWAANGSFDHDVGGMLQNVGSPATVDFGSWQDLKFYIKANTPGQSDGIVRMWVNNSLKLEYTNSYMRENTNFNPNQFILSDYNPGDTSRVGVQWWDNVTLTETNPGAQLAPPNPPTIHE
jgi:hypothetical protein